MLTHLQERIYPCRHSPASVQGHVGAAHSSSRSSASPVVTTMPGLPLLALLTGPGKPIWAPRTGAGINWPGLANVFHGESTSGLQWLCSPTIFFFFFPLLNSKTIPQMSFCLISVLMNISGYTTSPPAVTPEPQAMLSRCCLCAVSSGC